MDCPFQEKNPNPASLVFEAEYYLHYSIDFLIYMISNQAFINSIIHATIGTIHNNETHSYIACIKDTHQNDIILYSVQSTNQMQCQPLLLSFLIKFDESMKRSLLNLKIEVMEMTMKKEAYIFICKTIIKQLIHEINTPVSNQIQRVQDTFSIKGEILWKCITEWQFAKWFYKGQLTSMVFEGNPANKGSIIKCEFNKNVKCEMVVIESDTRSKKWVYDVEPILGNKEIQEVKFYFEPIDDCTTILTYENIFKEKVTYETLFRLRETKLKFLEKLRSHYSSE